MKPQNAPEAAGIGNDSTPGQKIAQRPDMGPLRRCGDCLSFQPDAVNPPQGIGRCALTITGLPPAPVRGYGCCYPFSPRQCPSYEGAASE